MKAGSTNKNNQKIKDMKTSKILGLVCIIFMVINFTIEAMDMVQTIRGTVVDLISNKPLCSANVVIYRDSTIIDATITNEEGEFRFQEIPLGRYDIVISYVGYQTVLIPDVVVNSSKEIVLSIEMEESPLQIGEISFSASGGKGKAINPLAFGSARTFSADESERYAGSRGDPARMASNFAGVQGNDDSNNDLVIRGNSPLGVLWRLEGVNIPNPNHFGVCGTTGGPVTMLNNRVLTVSDFMTGAFPAEFGNSVAGVFDLKMRSGNNENHEFSGQFGFLGTEAMAEGPVSRAGKSSYLVNYRYSARAGEVVYMNDQKNQKKFNDYFRADLKINYRLNTPKLTHEIGLDIVNITNRSNILKQTYVYGAEPPVIESYQLGILPIFYYRVDF